MELAELQRLYAQRRRDFSWVDLRGQNLSDLNLREIILRDSNLDTALLVRTNLQNARLPRAKLNYANLQSANLAGAKLTKASLVGANLRGVNLSNADLQGADLTSACLDQAIVANTNFQGAILTGVDWGNTDLSGAIFDPQDQDDRLISVSNQVIEIITDAQHQSRPIIEFEDKWDYRPEDLLSPPQKLALSPIIWLVFVFGGYLYQGLFASGWLKWSYSLLFNGLAVVSPLLWMLAGAWFWLYPAIVTGVILLLTFDWFSFIFAAIAIPLSLSWVKKYRAVLDKTHVNSWTEMSRKFRRSVLRDGLSLALWVIVFVTMFRLLFVHAGMVFYWLSTLITALAGGIVVDLLDKKSLPPSIAVVLLGATSWLALGIGWWWRYAPNLN